MSIHAANEGYEQVQLLFLLPAELRGNTEFVAFGVIGFIVAVTAIITAILIVFAILKRSSTPSAEYLAKVEARGKAQDAERLKKFRKDKVKKDDIKVSNDIKQFISDGEAQPDVGTMAMDPDTASNIAQSENQTRVPSSNN